MKRYNGQKIGTHILTTVQTVDYKNYKCSFSLDFFPWKDLGEGLHALNNRFSIKPITGNPLRYTCLVLLFTLQVYWNLFIFCLLLTQHVHVAQIWMSKYRNK